MKKAYAKPEARKVSFKYTKVMAASGKYCDQGWTKATVLIPWEGCSKCYDEFIWIGSTKP